MLCRPTGAFTHEVSLFSELPQTIFSNDCIRKETIWPRSRPTLPTSVGFSIARRQDPTNSWENPFLSPERGRYARVLLDGLARRWQKCVQIVRSNLAFGSRAQSRRPSKGSPRLRFSARSTVQRRAPSRPPGGPGPPARQVFPS